MSGSLVARVRHLLALAGHPETPIEEARTAAHQAAKLIAQHGMEVRGRGAHDEREAWSSERPRAPWESTAAERAEANKAYEARVAAEKAQRK